MIYDLLGDHHRVVSRPGLAGRHLGDCIGSVHGHLGMIPDGLHWRQRSRRRLFKAQRLGLNLAKITALNIKFIKTLKLNVPRTNLIIEAFHFKLWDSFTTMALAVSVFHDHEDLLLGCVAAIVREVLNVHDKKFESFI